MRQYIVNLLKRREVTVIGFLIGLNILVGLANHSFLAPNNFMLTLKGSAMYIFLALGMTFVLFTKEIDVSVGSVLGISAAVAGTMLNHSANVVSVIAVTLLVGIICGLINGLGVTAFKVPSIVMTLGTAGIIRGLMYIYTDGKWVENLPDYFKKASQANLFGKINIFVLLTVAVVIIVQIFISKSSKGKFFAAVGDNIDGAVNIGINVSRIKLLSFILSGLCASVAALIYVSQIGFVSSVAGNGLEMTTIAACVIGGVSLNGGTGSIVGAAFGAIIMTTINSALVFLKVPAYWNDAISGFLLIVIVVVDIIVHTYMSTKIRRQRLLNRTMVKEGETNE